MKIAIIGCGKQSEKHIGGIRAVLPDAEILVNDAQDQFAQRLAEKTGAAVSSLDDILADDAVRGAIICTPTFTHTDISCQLLDAGKHVLCEKPLSETLADAQRLADHAARADRGVAVGYIYRQAPRFLAVHDVLNHGEQPVGDVRMAHFRAGGRGDHAPWKHRAETGGGAINEMLVHMMDLAQWMLGPIASIGDVHTRNLRPVRTIGGQVVEQDVEDYVMLRATFESGAEATIEADLSTSSFVQHVEILGENGNVFTSVIPSMPSYAFLKEARGGLQGGSNPLTPEGGDFYIGQTQQFLNMMDGKAHNLHVASDTIGMFAHLETIRSSAKTGA